MNLILGLKEERGKRGRGAAGKKWVFGLLKRGEKVFTQSSSSQIVQKKL